MIRSIKIVIIILVLDLAIKALEASAQQDLRSVGQCGAGGYVINSDPVICKANPTGCVHGDSIALGPDCDKFN